MDDNKTSTDKIEQGYTVKMEKVIEQDYTIRMEKVTEEDHTAKIEKVIEKDTKWNRFKKLVYKYTTTCTKKISKYTTACVKKVGKYTAICGKEVGKYTIICAKKVDECTNSYGKKISETKFAVIMNAKYSEVYGNVRKALMRITCRLASKNETKGVKVVEQLKGLDASDTTLKAKIVTVEKINTFLILIFKKAVALVRCVAVFTLNAITILGILVARVVYYTAKEIIYASKEIVLALKDNVIAWYQSEL